MAGWHRPGKSFGKRLIAALSDQIGALVSVENYNGTQFLIQIPRNETSPAAILSKKAIIP